MQINMIKKKRKIIPYLILLFLTFLATVSYNTVQKSVSVEYSARTKNIGWTETRTFQCDNKSNSNVVYAKKTLDDNNESFNGLKIALNGKFKGGISYSMHTSDGKWLDWEKNGNVLGSDSKKGINAIKVKLYGNISKRYNIEYRVLSTTNIWSDWVSNGAVAQNADKKEIINIEINISAKDTPIESIAKLVKKATTPESALDYDSEETVAQIADENIPSADTPADETEYSNGLTALPKAIKGIDVSYYNGKINWDKVKSDGIKYAIIQVGYRGKTLGTLKDDSCFEYNIKNAIEAGLDVGVYYVTQAKTTEEAKQEANYVIKKLSNYTIQYPVYIDIEEVSMSRARNLTNAQRTAVCKTFCNTIMEAGYQAGVYSCKYWFESKLNTKELKDYNLWVAAYDSKTKPKMNCDYQIWQCSETGTVSGITGKVDINYCYVDYLNVDVIKPIKQPESTPMPTDEPSPEEAVG